MNIIIHTKDGKTIEYPNVFSITNTRVNLKKFISLIAVDDTTTFIKGTLHIDVDDVAKVEVIPV